MKYFKLYIVFVLLFTLASQVYSQKAGYLKISGQVKSGKTKVANATVNLYDGSAKVNTATTSAAGDFTFNLDYDKSYTIEILAADYATKKVLVDTKIPEKDLIYKYTFTVELFEKVQGVDYSPLDKPVTKIVYNDEADAFDYDIPYTESMRKQIEQITTQIESVKKQSYSQIIAKADENFKNQQYEDAITLYEKAIDIDPYSDYPDKQIMQCEKLIAQTRNNETNYNKYIAQGDNLLNKQDLSNAKTAYQNASTIKPTEAYPKQKIAEIDKLLADKNSKDKDDKYNAAIAKADAAFTKQTYDEAKVAYNQALTIKPTEAYPKTKIAEIDKLIADKAAKEKADTEAKAKAIADAKAKDDQYNAAIAKGDAALTKQSFDEAKSAYNQALTIKPNETYPKTKLAEIDKLVADKAAKEKAAADAKAKDDQYNAAIAKGDAALTKQSFDEAKAAYNQALTIKPTETYPKTKLAEIDKLVADKAAKDKAVADAKAKDDQYNAAIAKGDAALTKQSFDEAKSAYNQALTIKPNETYPKTKLAEIDKLVADKAAKEKAAADAKAKDDQYNAAIAKGDAALTKQSFDEAKSAYNQALTIKPNETYPKTKLAEIDKLVADKAAKEKADADAKAKSEADAKAKEEKYKAAVTKGDAALEKMQLTEAKDAYTEASSLKPEETYPKNKLVEVNNLIAQKQKKEQDLNQKDKAYNDAMEKADNSYRSKDYSTAITYYQTALKQKPNETTPKQRITECQDLLRKRNEEEQKRLADEKQRQIDENAAKMKKLEEVNFTDKAEADKYLSDLAKTYPEGVTEESYEDKTKKIKRVIVNKEGVANEYRQVTHSWGGEYFFKNGQSISKNLFLIETKK